MYEASSAVGHLLISLNSIYDCYAAGWFLDYPLYLASLGPAEVITTILLCSAPPAIRQIYELGQPQDVGGGTGPMRSVLAPFQHTRGLVGDRSRCHVGSPQPTHDIELN